MARPHDSASQVTLARVTSRDDFARCERLFEEYVTWVIDLVRAEYDLDGFDPRPHHDAFRAESPALFGARGRLYLATVDGTSAGVGALKPVSDTIAEVKRMFVRPAFRRHGVARAVLASLMDDARTIGYERLRLESLELMTAAHSLYRSVGFADTGPFDDNEAAMSNLNPATIFMEAPFG